ncbi:MAG: apolipoprotein N-acyltransferase [Campylobacterota bacterium]|nr:apolipoprotein N-acyltransferase [Campylobacterota bacterium]
MKTKTILINDFVVAVLLALSFSSFIYLEHFDLTYKILNSLSGIVAFYLLLHVKPRIILLSGFFIGLLWFYWIGYSFEYYHVSYMIPIVTLGFGFVYLLFFGVLALTQKVWLRALFLIALSFIEPFDYNWMVLELPFIESYFGVEKWQFILILMALSFFLTCKDKRRYGAILLLIAALDYSNEQKPMPDLKIKLIAMDIPQELKWKPFMQNKINTFNFNAIDKAIDDGYDLVILPESAFALFLNMHPDLLEILKEKSMHISIITGALYYENHNNYNVTYLFQEGRETLAKKMTLVPFGEYIPLPKFIREYVNQTFFDGASDYISADAPTDFMIKGTSFRNAICYEATCEELYEGKPKYMIAISNNAWFMPSIEATLQKLLMRYYAKRHGTIIFHAANAEGTGVIK